jgi:hypothetical protein
MNRETIAEQAYRRFARHIERCRQCSQDSLCATGRILESGWSQAEISAQVPQTQMSSQSWSTVERRVAFTIGNKFSYVAMPSLIHPNCPGIFICWFDSSNRWHLHHEASGLAITVNGYTTADEAVAVAAALRHIDWTRSAADLRTDGDAERAVSNIS